MENISKTWRIYKHTLTLDCESKGKSYIGQTCYTNIFDRSGSSGNRYNGRVFSLAINRYGWDNFSHEIIEDNISTQEEANEREKYWIAYYHTYLKDEKCWGYNMTPGGEQWGNLAYKWYNNGINEICIPLSTDVPNGFVSGRLPMSLEQKKKLSVISYNNKSGERLGKQIAGRVHIHKENLDKSVYKDELQDYLADGWLAGRSDLCKSKNFKKIRCIETNEEFESLLAATNKYGSHVFDVLKGKRKHTHHLHFEYL